MGFVKKMAPAASEGILRTKHECGFKLNYICEEKGLQTLKISFFPIFEKILEINTEVLEPSILSEIDNWSLLFKMSLNWLHAQLK